MKKFICMATLAILPLVMTAGSMDMKVERHYLNLPVSESSPIAEMTLTAPGIEEYSFKIRLNAAKPDYWVYCELSRYMGKTVTITYNGDEEALKAVYQDDTFVGEDILYKESGRPQQHFTFKRGWNNDPNGMIWYDGEYHLFGQHNPYEASWNNMHWGHAVSTDMIHWTQVQEALIPDTTGAMFSGTAVVDYKNTSGFGEVNNPAMIAIYTAHIPGHQTQCLAYSLDHGRNWTKYEGNPVLDSSPRYKPGKTRDPKVFWHSGTGKWVMALYEMDGISFYSSDNLKDMIGDFDGKRFMPCTGLQRYTQGEIYAGQTFNDMPDGRIVQIGWEKAIFKGMPFKNTFTTPLEMTLRTTKDGIRLFAEPVREFDDLQKIAVKAEGINGKKATEMLAAYNSEESLRIKFTMSMPSSNGGAGLTLDGQRLGFYEAGRSLVNSQWYSPSYTDIIRISFDIILDRGIAEVYVDSGAFSQFVKKEAKNDDGFKFIGNATIDNLEIYTLDSIWN